MNKRITFAIVGYGRIGQKHAQIIAACDNSELVAVCESKSDVDVGNVAITKNIGELLSGSANFDVLVICTPNGLHHEHALAGLKAGKHVIIEKPVALTRAHCEGIIAESIIHKKQVFCVMQNRYAAVAKWLKELVDCGALGKIFFVQINCFWNRDERYYTKNSWHGTAEDGGVLFTQFSHFIDTVLWLFGDICNLSGKFANYKQLNAFEDTGVVHFGFKNGGLGSLNYTTACFDKNVESSITIIAEQGTVKVAGQNLDSVEYFDVKGQTAPELIVEELSNHQRLYENVMNTLMGNDRFAIKVSDGLKVVETIQKIYALKRQTA